MLSLAEQVRGTKLQVSVTLQGNTDARPGGALRLDVLAGVLAAFLSVAIAAGALIASRRYFLNDDYATQFIPVFREIARLLGAGHFPLVTDRLWLGGALTQEYQYAVFNPVSLVLYWLVGRIDDLPTAAAAFSLIHIAILAGGAYFFCRVLGCARRHAFLVAVLTPLSDWTFFWGATDWIPGLVSMAWLVWAWGFLILTFRRPTYAPAAAAAVAMTLLSGWPFADLALLVSVLVAARVWLASQPSASLRAAAWTALAFAGGCLLSAPAVVPLELYSLWVNRPAVDGLWAMDLSGLLEFGMPFVQGHWGSFYAGGLDLVRVPTVYAAWFAPLVLASANWRLLLKDRAVWVILGSAAAFAALSMISHIGQLRWMFRLLPYFQFAVLAMVAIALTRADEEGQTWNFDRMALVIAVEVWLAFSQAHNLAFLFVGAGYVIGLLAWITLRFKGRRDLRWTAFALATSVGIFWITVWMTLVDGHPRWPQAWTPPDRAAATVETSARAPRYGIFFQMTEPADPGAAFWTTYRPLNIALEQPGTSILGYSSMLTSSLGPLLCHRDPGPTCGQVVTRVTTPVPPTDRSLTDLMSVGEVVVQHPADAAKFAAWAGAGWRETRGPAGEWRFDRIRPLGLVTWASSGAGALIQSSSPARITAQARNDAPTPATIILARAWYPGWSARLNGAPLVARPLAGLLVSVQLPPRSAGRLDVSFWPSGLTAGLVLAAIGALLIALAALFPRLIDGLIEKLGAAPPTKPRPRAA